MELQYPHSKSWDDAIDNLGYNDFIVFTIDKQKYKLWSTTRKFMRYEVPRFNKIGKFEKLKETGTTYSIVYTINGYEREIKGVKIPEDVKERAVEYFTRLVAPTIRYDLPLQLRL
tara:strand:+ start:1401 stop:1745 length:345 start_codon:yes stop_codon:yes gene_type:complete